MHQTRQLRVGWGNHNLDFIICLILLTSFRPHIAAVKWIVISLFEAFKLDLMETDRPQLVTLATLDFSDQESHLVLKVIAPKKTCLHIFDRDSIAQNHWWHLRCFLRPPIDYSWLSILANKRFSTLYHKTQRTRTHVWNEGKCTRLVLFLLGRPIRDV